MLWSSNTLLSSRVERQYLDWCNFKLSTRICLTIGRLGAPITKLPRDSRHEVGYLYHYQSPPKHRPSRLETLVRAGRGRRAGRASSPWATSLGPSFIGIMLCPSTFLGHGLSALRVEHLLWNTSRDQLPDSLSPVILASG